MSDPYGGGYEPYQPRPNPYGPSNEGPSPALPWTSPPTPTDGISIAALVCSLTCCAAPVGIGLGIAGLVRTSGNRRRGRWAAVTGVVVGAVVLVCGLGFAVFAGIMGSRTVWEDEARVGQCVDLSSFLSTEIDLVKARCDEPHDAEVIWVGQLDSRSTAEFRSLSTWAFCTSRRGLEADHLHALLAGDYDIGFTTDASDNEKPRAGDHVVCFVERADGKQLTDSLARLH